MHHCVFNPATNSLCRALLQDKGIEEPKFYTDLQGYVQFLHFSQTFSYKDKNIQFGPSLSWKVSRSSRDLHGQSALAFAIESIGPYCILDQSSLLPDMLQFVTF